jgi:hypothetical protein
MPDHVHALFHFRDRGILCRFIQQWKRKNRLKKFLQEHLPAYTAAMALREPISLAGFYDFNVFSIEKAIEVLQYMLNNPVRRGLVANPEDWNVGSAGWYFLQRWAGVELVALS